MSDVLEQFVEIAGRIVYATLATVDRRGRPRARIVHPVWEQGPEGLTGWVGTRPTALTRGHVGNSPFASCLYWDQDHDVAVAECSVSWVEQGGLRDAWDRLSLAPAPMGYDPTPIWPSGPQAGDFAALRLVPWRLQTRSAAALAAGEPYSIWVPADGSAVDA